MWQFILQCHLAALLCFFSGNKASIWSDRDRLGWIWNHHQTFFCRPKWETCKFFCFLGFFTTVWCFRVMNLPRLLALWLFPMAHYIPGDSVPFSEIVSKWNRHHAGKEEPGVWILWWIGKKRPCSQYEMLVLFDHHYEKNTFQFLRPLD